MFRGELGQQHPTSTLVISVGIALVANVAALGYIVYRAKKLGVNPYTHEVFTGTRDFVKAMDRREDENGELAA